jgi:hypothetical protein
VCYLTEILSKVKNKKKELLIIVAGCRLIAQGAELRAMHESSFKIQNSSFNIRYSLSSE